MVCTIQLKHTMQLCFIQTPLLRIITRRQAGGGGPAITITIKRNAIAQVEYLIRKELLTEECHTCRHHHILLLI